MFKMLQNIFAYLDESRHSSILYLDVYLLSLWRSVQSSVHLLKIFLFSVNIILWNTNQVAVDKWIATKFFRLHFSFQSLLCMDYILELLFYFYIQLEWDKKRYESSQLVLRCLYKLNKQVEPYFKAEQQLFKTFYHS